MEFNDENDQWCLLLLLMIAYIAIYVSCIPALGLFTGFVTSDVFARKLRGD